MSTEKFTKNEVVLKRLLEAIEAAGVRKYGRNRRVAEITGYSEARISEMLSGKLPLNPKFLSLLCSKFHISEDFVLNGAGEVFTEKPGGGVVAEGETEYAILAKLRKLLPPEKRILFDEIVKMSNEEAEVMLRDHIARLRDRQEKEK